MVLLYVQRNHDLLSTLVDEVKLKVSILPLLLLHQDQQHTHLVPVIQELQLVRLSLITQDVRFQDQIQILEFQVRRVLGLDRHNVHHHKL